ncbi:autotransporter domain-containing protein [Kosakonia sp. BK9b]
MQKPVFRKTPLSLAVIAAQLLLAQQALAAEANVISSDQSNGIQIVEAHSTYDVLQNVIVRGTSEDMAGIYAGTAIGTFTNAGTITSVRDNGPFRVLGLNVQNHINTLINTGAITAENVANAAAVFNGGTIDSLQNSGYIYSETGLRNLRNIGALTNNGTISGALYGINSDNFAYGANTVIGDITNNGLISGNTAINSNAPMTTVNNNGAISGALAAINSSGAIGTLNNSGSIVGDILYTSSSSMTLNGSAQGGALFGVFTGQNGVMGTLASQNADLYMGSGHIWMNDNIDVGSHKLINQAAVLRLNQPTAITGNYLQKADATLEIGVNDNAVINTFTGDSGYGRLNVSGIATFEPGSNVVLARNGASYNFAAGQRYLVALANMNGTNYNESSLHYAVENFNGKAVGGTYMDMDSGQRGLVVVLRAADPVLPGDSTVITPPDTSLAPQPTKGLATTRNAASSLKGLSGYSGFADGLLDLYNASLAISSREEANKAGEQLSPVQNIAAGSTASAASLNALSVVSNHVDSVRLARNGSVQRGIATGDDPLDWAVWGQPFYGNVRQGMIDNVSGYTAHYGGLVLGADRQIAEAWRAGGAMTYSHASVRGSDNLTGNHTDVDAWGGVAYASWSGNPWYVNLSASVTRQQFDSQRVIAFDGFSGQAKGKFNGLQTVTKAEAGYPILFGEGTTLTPLAAMSYSYLHQKGYREHSDSGAALNVDSSHSQSVRHSVGGKLEHSWSTPAGDLVPFAQVMWSHEYDRSRTATGASYVADSVGETRFTSLGATPVADTADISAGVTLVQGDDLSISARYDLSTAPHFDAQTVSLRLRKLF